MSRNGWMDVKITPTHVFYGTRGSSSTLEKIAEGAILEDVLQRYSDVTLSTAPTQKAPIMGGRYALVDQHTGRRPESELWGAQVLAL